MNKTSTDKFLRFLKMFFYTFSASFACVIIFFLITTKVFNYSNRYIDWSVISFILFMTSIGSSLGGLKHYKKYTTNVTYKEIRDKDKVIKLQKIMKKMHWSIKKNDGKQIIFKSFIFITLWTEYLVVTINRNNLELEGPELYVNKIVRKLKA